ncbi:uncharacterized protein [Nicotiana tomentosiformis]|uniref:uncharacterized protein n=1 Tax=Nicotiana tomentosiformis TaxID=4098 RepID=UPI00388C9FE0
MNRDEDLLLFRDMYKREKNELASFLLLPVSNELEANGNYALYRMASSKKGQVGLDYLMNETGKNDYDWLKTPPATPLFPSLDMEANAPELVIQKEIPIIQPIILSRFADKSGAAKTRSTLIIRSASPNPKPKVATRNLTPTGKQQGASSIDKKNTRYATTTTITATNQLKVIKSNNSVDQNAIRPTRQKETHLNFLASNLSKTMGMKSSLSSNSKSRGVSPAGRPKILAQLPGFSDETPVNLRTDRSLSATRGRSINQHQSTNQRPGSSSSSSSSSSAHITKPIRRQSCSPSVTRGRKQDISTTSTKFQQGNVTTQVLGSKMVDKFLNARKSVYEEKEITKAKLNGCINERSGFGRHISRISANVEIRQDSGNSGKNGTTTGRKSSNIRSSRIPAT